MSNQEEFEPVITSVCCGVEFNMDYGICPECGEHCSGEIWDENGMEVTPC